MAQEATPARVRSPVQLSSGTVKKRLETDLPRITPTRAAQAFTHDRNLHTIAESSIRRTTNNPIFDDEPVYQQKKYYCEIGDWQNQLAPYLWPGNTEVGYNFQRWYRSAIQGLHTAVSLYPPGFILPSRLLQAVRGISVGAAYYTSEYTHWINTQIRSHRLMERALSADNLTTLPSHAVE